MKIFKKVLVENPTTDDIIAALREEAGVTKNGARAFSEGDIVDCSQAKIRTGGGMTGMMMRMRMSGDDEGDGEPTSAVIEQLRPEIRKLYKTNNGFGPSLGIVRMYDPDDGETHVTYFDEDGEAQTVSITNAPDAPIMLIQKA